MSRFHSYLNSAKEILGIYKGEEPFAAFLKKYFAQHKKFGSKDRKQVSHLCYCYFRLGKSFTGQVTDENILASLFLCSDQNNEILQSLKPEWDEKGNLSITEKFSILNIHHSITDVFPWKEELSDGIDHEKFCQSFFYQPDLFLRLRPGKKDIVTHKLQNAGISFKSISDSCMALPNTSKIDEIIKTDNEVVVQDYSSQRTVDFIKSEILNLASKIRIWDCCAGSGGKSIILYDINPQIELIVSDKRESILHNLERRFEHAGIKNYKSFVTDLSLNRPDFLNLKPEIIIADVPCTGSGTWSRTPEQLYYFKKEKIDEYTGLQKKIISNVIPFLPGGGHLFYITCSVFKKENEEIVEWIKQNFNLYLVSMEVLRGYEKKADSMFAALLKRIL